jgi:hypothetical protein
MSILARYIADLASWRGRSKPCLEWRQPIDTYAGRALCDTLRWCQRWGCRACGARYFWRTIYRFSTLLQRRSQLREKPLMAQQQRQQYQRHEPCRECFQRRHIPQNADKNHRGEPIEKTTRAGRHIRLQLRGQIRIGILRGRYDQHKPDYGKRDAHLAQPSFHRGALYGLAAAGASGALSIELFVPNSNPM